MKKFDYEEALNSVSEMLQDKVADYLDVNRQHINILSIETEICGEDCIDWDEDEEDAAEGEEFETYRRILYQYREDIRNIDYKEPECIVWRHIEGENRLFDEVMSVEEFEKLFESKKHNVCSMMWYEGE